MRALIVLGILVALLGAAYGVRYLSYLPRFSITDIAVAGTKEIRAEAVRLYAESIISNGSNSFFSRANILLYPRREIEQAIANYFPRVKSVHVSRTSMLGNAISVAIEERESFARWCMPQIGESDQCYFMDKTGFVFAAASSSAATESYTFSGGFTATSSPIGQTFLPGNFASVLALLERLGQTGFTPTLITAENEQDFSVAVLQGFLIRASYGADINGLVRDLQLVLSSEALRGRESQLEYIDLRFGNRVYYKLKGDAATSAQ